MISIQTSVSKGWLHNEGVFRFDERYYFDPFYRWEQDRAIDRFLADRFPQHPFHNMESNLVQGEYFSPDQVLVGGIQPNLIVGACLGAAFVFPPDKDSDIAGRPLDCIRSAADLPAPAVLLDHPLIRQLGAQIADVRQARPDHPWLHHHRPETLWRRCIRAGIRRPGVRRRAARLDHNRLHRAHPALRPFG
jgi:hypothetical protein